jgi:hypothetical protein
MHLATDSGILLQIQASCYRFRHLATDSGILLQIQAICYRVMQSDTGSCNLLQGHAICYRVMHSATRSCILLQGHAICYRVMQSATGSCSLIQGHASILAKLHSIDEKLKQLEYQEKLMEIGKNYVFCRYWTKTFWKRQTNWRDNQQIEEYGPKLAEKIEKINTVEEGKKEKNERKHAVVKTESFPSQCCLCEILCENSSDLEKHIVTHSLKEISYNCKECDFVWQNEVTMEVHFGKLHPEKFECGLCALEEGSLENIEIHFNTHKVQIVDKDSEH